MPLHQIRRYVRTVKARKSLLEALKRFNSLNESDYLGYYSILESLIQAARDLKVKEAIDTPETMMIYVRYQSLDDCLRAMNGLRADKRKESFMIVEDWLGNDATELSLFNQTNKALNSIAGMVTVLGQGTNDASKSSIGRSQKSAIHDLVSFYEWLYGTFYLVGRES